MDFWGRVTILSVVTADSESASQKAMVVVF